MRDNVLLSSRLNYLWIKYFSDLPRINKIEIKFGRKVKKRLGSIRRINKVNEAQFDSLITINGHFKDTFIPEFVIDATIVHEMCHYAHGFSSPLPQLYRYPHRGEVIDKEMARRNLADLEYQENDWLQSNWLKYLAQAK